MFLIEVHRGCYRTFESYRLWIRYPGGIKLFTIEAAGRLNRRL